jgi:hypothetical protein
MKTKPKIKTKNNLKTKTGSSTLLKVGSLSLLSLLLASTLNNESSEPTNTIEDTERDWLDCLSSRFKLDIDNREIKFTLQVSKDSYNICIRLPSDTNKLPGVYIEAGPNKKYPFLIIPVNYPCELNKLITEDGISRFYDQHGITLTNEKIKTKQIILIKMIEEFNFLIKNIFINKCDNNTISFIKDNKVVKTFVFTDIPELKDIVAIQTGLNKANYYLDTSNIIELKSTVYNYVYNNLAILELPELYRDLLSLIVRDWYMEKLNANPT